METEDKKLLALLGSVAEKGMLSVEIAETLGVSQHTAWNRVSKLIRAGRVRRVWVSRENPWTPGGTRLQPGYAIVNKDEGTG